MIRSSKVLAEPWPGCLTILSEITISIRWYPPLESRDLFCHTSQIALLPPKERQFEPIMNKEGREMEFQTSSPLHLMFQNQEKGKRTSIIMKESKNGKEKGAPPPRLELGSTPDRFNPVRIAIGGSYSTLEL